MNSENINSEEKKPLLKSFNADEEKQYNQIHGNWQAIDGKMILKNKFLNADLQTLKQPKLINSTYLGIDRALAEIVDFIKTDDFNKFNDYEISELRSNYKRLVNLKFDVLHPLLNLDDLSQLKTFSDSVRSILGVGDNPNFSDRFTGLQENTFSELNSYYIEKEKGAIIHLIDTIDEINVWDEYLSESWFKVAIEIANGEAERIYKLNGKWTITANELFPDVPTEKLEARSKGFDYIRASLAKMLGSSMGQAKGHLNIFNKEEEELKTVIEYCNYHKIQIKDHRFIERKNLLSSI